ncbi:hypothetical protein OHA25_16695 [Nonomuraea sp. NBC_00507]|uniref:hypothetical protein n=1 Tax=Nonomuraea sp. NBC_00507 TaxID=2976002 RepID=UPI002E189940
MILQQRLPANVTAVAKSVRLHVAPPLCPLGVSPADFGHSPDLIARARKTRRPKVRLSQVGLGNCGFPHP